MNEATLTIISAAVVALVLYGSVRAACAAIDWLLRAREHRRAKPKGKK